MFPTFYNRSQPSVGSAIHSVIRIVTSQIDGAETTPSLSENERRLFPETSTQVVSEILKLWGYAIISDEIELNDCDHTLAKDRQLAIYLTIRSGQVGQVWGHTPEQRVAASTPRQYSLGFRLAIAQADARPVSLK